MKYLTIIFILISQFANGQTEYGTVSYPTQLRSVLMIHVRDSVEKELGYYRLDLATGRTTTRGSSTITWRYFIREVFIPMYELNFAKLQIIKQIKSDGTIRDTTLYKQAITNYELMNKQYGYREW